MDKCLINVAIFTWVSCIHFIIVYCLFDIFCESSGEYGISFHIEI